jgi:hypothetical protein
MESAGFSNQWTEARVMKFASINTSPIVGVVVLHPTYIYWGAQREPRCGFV